jgi:hypothetical protein
VQSVFFPALGVFWLVWLAGQVLSYRRSSGDRRLQDAVDLGTVRADLLGVVQGALEPAHLSMWIRPVD